MSLKLVFTIWVILTVPINLPAQGQEVKYAASAVKADLAFMYETLEKSHYNLYAYVSKAKYDAGYNKILASVKQDSLSQLSAIKLFQKLAAIGNVGHSEVDFPAQPYIAYLQEGGTVFPMELAFEDGKAFISTAYTDNPNIHAGEQVLRINNVPVHKLQREIHPYLSAERPYFKDVKLELWSFPRYYWSAFGEKKKFEVEVKSHDGEIKTYTIKAIPAIEFETVRNDKVLNENRSYRLIGNTAYLDPGPFSSSLEKGEEKFKAFIDSAFADIRTRNIGTLIIDFRNNSGGHNSYSDYLIAYFADKPFRWYSKYSLKTSEALKEQTKRNTPEAEKDEFARAILSHKNGEIFDFDFPVQAPMPEHERFKGKVLVLVNRHTYSMAAVSAALVQDYGFAELVGEESGDIPTLYASQFTFTLPETGVTVKVPKGYIVRPSGDERLRGVIPDHQVKDQLSTEKDEVLQFTLKNIVQPDSSDGNH